MTLRSKEVIIWTSENEEGKNFIRNIKPCDLRFHNDEKVELEKYIEKMT